MWGQFGKYISFHEECAIVESFLHLCCWIVSDLFLRPTNPMQSLGVRFEERLIHDAVIASLQSSNRIDQDVGICSGTVHSTAAGLAWIPIAVVTHAIVQRLALTKGTKAFYKKKLELLQYVSIAMVTVVPYHKAFVGDNNTCILSCKKCKCRFGRTGNMFQILAEACNAIYITMDWNCLELA
jgi:hypothetical protein